MDIPTRMRRIANRLDLSAYGWEFIKEYYDYESHGQRLLRIYEKEGKYLCIGIRNDWPFRSLELNTVPIVSIVSPDSYETEVQRIPGWDTGWDEDRLREILALTNDNFNNYYNNYDRFWAEGQRIYDDINERTMTDDERKLRRAIEISLLPEIPTDECAICHDELISEDDECVVTNCCNRSFHRGCLSDWFSSGRATCPNCRRNISMGSTRRCTKYTSIEKTDGRKAKKSRRRSKKTRRRSKKSSRRRIKKSRRRSKKSKRRSKKSRRRLKKY
jgi:hypothetical protein